MDGYIEIQNDKKRKRGLLEFLSDEHFIKYKKFGFAIVGYDNGYFNAVELSSNRCWNIGIFNKHSSAHYNRWDKIKVFKNKENLISYWNDNNF